MKLAVAVHFEGDDAQVAALAFDDWDAPEPLRQHSARLANVDKAARGQRELRQLPCLLSLLRTQALTPELIVIDGLVHLDAQETPGWGRHLFEALGGRVAVIGITKTAPKGMPAQFEVFREADAAPVIVTCAGIDIGAAKARVRAMHGQRRMPTLLKRVLRSAKGDTSAAG